jgi:hypothetical protein
MDISIIIPNVSDETLEQIQIKLNGQSVNHYIKPVKDDKIEIVVFDNKFTIIFNNVKKYTDLTID